MQIDPSARRCTAGDARCLVRLPGRIGWSARQFAGGPDQLLGLGSGGHVDDSLDDFADFPRLALDRVEGQLSPQRVRQTAVDLDIGADDAEFGAGLYRGLEGLPE
jgi:hypothetical protein